MKKSIFFFLAFLIVAGFAVAQESGRSVQGMMKGDKDGEHMGSSMMRIMKMMDQCSAMMESAQTDAGAAKESQNQ